MTNELTNCACGSPLVYISADMQQEDMYRGACTECGVETVLIYKKHNVAKVWNRMQNATVVE